MTQSPVLLIWIEGRDRRLADFAVAEHDLDVGVVHVPPGDQGPPAGRYLRLDEDRSAVITPQQPRPVLVRDTHSTSEKSWVKPFVSPDDEVMLADQVRRKVQEAVELEIADGAVAIGPTTTYVTQSPTGGLLMHGVCVIAREAVKAR